MWNDRTLMQRVYKLNEGSLSPPPALSFSLPFSLSHTHTHQSWSVLVSNHLDAAVVRLILYLLCTDPSILTSEWRCSPVCQRIIINRPLFIYCCVCVASPLAGPIREPAGATVWVTDKSGPPEWRRWMERGGVYGWFERAAGQRIYTPCCYLSWEKLPEQAVNWCKRVEGSKKELPRRTRKNNDFINALIWGY